MLKLGIRSVIRRKRKYFGNASKIIKPNILEQDFRTGKSNSKWSTDVTNLYYKNNRFYLCVILDLYNREILSYIMSSKKRQSVSNKYNKQGNLKKRKYGRSNIT